MPDICNPAGFGVVTVLTGSGVTLLVSAGITRYSEQFENTAAEFYVIGGAAPVGVGLLSGLVFVLAGLGRAPRRAARSLGGRRSSHRSVVDLTRVPRVEFSRFESRPAPPVRGVGLGAALGREVELRRTAVGTAVDSFRFRSALARRQDDEVALLALHVLVHANGFSPDPLNCWRWYTSCRIGKGPLTPGQPYPLSGRTTGKTGLNYTRLLKQCRAVPPRGLG